MGFASAIPRFGPRFGPHRLDDKRFRFTLWAPDAPLGVSLCLGSTPGAEPSRLIPMTPLGDASNEASSAGWYSVDIEAAVGCRYLFAIQQAEGAAPLRVPDPASRLQADDVHDASVVTDDDRFGWRHPEWRGRPWHETVLLELHAGLNDGFRGVTARLPGLAEQGFTAIELMPIADFPGPRNWGYDGTLHYAPDTAYGSPDDLKTLIDTAHGLGLMVFLDVVYNHFGPDGNYLHAYAKSFFRHDVQTPWGDAIDFRRPAVRQFFTGNALYWLTEFRFDGLRLDAVHAISEGDWLDEMAATVRATITDRHVHLVLENDDNIASHLRGDFDAQWNDDAHHVLHTLLTDEVDGYYEDYADQPAEALARCLSSGFIYQGQPSPHRGGQARGQASGDLPPTAFVNFLQNHDQAGNRALGDRLISLADHDALRAAVVLLLLSPSIPLIFDGEQDGSAVPFLYFTSHGPDLAKAVFEGRQREFGRFTGFGQSPGRPLPDPNEPSTFDSSRFSESTGSLESTRAWQTLYRRLLRLRRERLFPRLAGASSLGAQALGPKAVRADWRLGDGSVLTVFCNLDKQAIALAMSAHAGAPAATLDTTPLFAMPSTAGDALREGQLPGHSSIVFHSFQTTETTATKLPSSKAKS